MTARVAGPSVRLVAVLALLSCVAPLATDMYQPGFPDMARALDTDASGIQLTLTTFMLGLTLGQLVFGPVSDRFGRRLPLLVSAGIAAASTIACALAPTLEWLIVFRAIQGVSGAAGLVISRAVVADTAGGRAAARLFGMLMALVSIAPILAPLIGGVVLTAGGWRGVFWLLAAATIVMVLAVALVVPETNPRLGRRETDPGRPLAGMRAVLSDPRYLGYTLAFACAFAALFCYVAGSSFVYQNVLGLTTGQTAVAFGATASVTTATSTISAKLVTRNPPRRLLRIGLAAMLTAAAVLCVAAASARLDLTLTLTLFAFFFLGLGLVLPNATALALEQVPNNAASGSAVLGALQTGFAAAVAPLIGLLGNHTALPMVLGMTACTGLAVLALRLTHTNTRPATQDASEMSRATRTRVSKANRLSTSDETISASSCSQVSRR